jgi:hypothetical protein
MLKSGAFDPEQAEVWSKQTGVPTEVYLVKNDHAREKAYRQWLKEKRDAEIKVCV